MSYSLDLSIYSLLNKWCVMFISFYSVINYLSFYIKPNHSNYETFSFFCKQYFCFSTIRMLINWKTMIEWLSSFHLRLFVLLLACLICIWDKKMKMIRKILTSWKKTTGLWTTKMSWTYSLKWNYFFNLLLIFFRDVLTIISKTLF